MLADILLSEMYQFYRLEVCEFDDKSFKQKLTK